MAPVHEEVTAGDACTPGPHELGDVDADLVRVPMTLPTSSRMTGAAPGVSNEADGVGTVPVHHAGTRGQPCAA